MLNKFLGFLLSLCLSQWAYSNTLVEATRAYDQGDYKTSIKIYEQWISEGLINGHTLYNLGNAYYRSGEKGKAMAALLGARSLLPRDPDVKANLEYVHKDLSDKLDYNEESSITQILTFWVSGTTPMEILQVFTLLWGVGMLSLILCLVFKKLYVLRSFSYTSLALSLIFLLAFGVSVKTQAKWGAVQSRIASVRSGPSSSNILVFELHEGAPFMVKDIQNGWYKIQLSDHKSGWIAKTEALVYGI